MVNDYSDGVFPSLSLFVAILVWGMHATVWGATFAAVPIGAQRVPFLVITLQNSCDERAVIDALRFRHRGLGEARDIARVYLQLNNRRISNAAGTFDDGQIDVRLRRLVLEPCAKAELNLLGDFASDAAPEGQHAFEIIDVETDHPANVQFTATPWIVTSKSGKSIPLLTAKFLRLPRLLTYGPRRVVARMQLKGDQRQDQWIHAITFTNDGSAKDEDVKNIFLQMSNGEELSTVVPFLDGDRVQMRLKEPFLLSRNQVVVFTLRADVRARRRKTINFIIDQPSDIEVGSVTRLR